MPGTTDREVGEHQPTRRGVSWRARPQPRKRAIACTAVAVTGLTAVLTSGAGTSLTAPAAEGPA